MNKITVTKLCCTEHDQAAEIGKGKIRDNALKAMVTSKLYQSKVEVPKKGKGSFKRKAKHKGKEPYSNVTFHELRLNRAFASNSLFNINIVYSCILLHP